MAKNSCTFEGSHLPRDLSQTITGQLQQLGWVFKGICPDTNTRHVSIPFGWHECIHEGRRAFKDARNRIRLGFVETYVDGYWEYVWAVMPFYRLNDDARRVHDANGRLRFNGKGIDGHSDTIDWLHNHGWPDPLAGWD